MGGHSAVPRFSSCPRHSRHGPTGHTTPRAPGRSRPALAGGAAVRHELIEVVWKTFFFYALLLVLLRVTGKREVGSLTAIDLVGFIMISEASIISIADGQIPLMVGMAPVLVLGVLEWVLAYLSLKDTRVRAAVTGEPSVLVAHGQVNPQALRKLRYSLGDLMAEMRAKNVANLADVEFAVLEPTGKLSLFPRAGARPVTADDLRSLGVTQADPATTLPHASPPATVILDGQVDDGALQRAGRDREWLAGELRRQGHADDPRRVLVAVLDGQGTLTVQDDPRPEPDSASPPSMSAGATEPQGRRASNPGEGGAAGEGGGGPAPD